MRQFIKKNIWAVAPVVFVLVALVLLGSPFGSGNVQETPAEDDNLIVVGVSQVGSESVWRTAHTQSVQDAFTRANGYLLIFDNARQKQANQIKAIRSFISQQVDYIVLSPIEETGWDTVLQEAKDAGIPVILMDRTVEVADDSLYTTWVGSDFIREGQDAGYWLEDYLKEQGRDEDEINIVVLQGTKGATATIGRTRGFNETAKIQHNWNILEQVDGEFTTAKGKEEMARLLEKYEDIDVVVSQNDDMTFGALEAIHAAGKTTGVNGDITVISFDAVDAGVELVRNGEINIDVQCNPDQGKYVEQVIKDMEAGKEVEKRIMFRNRYIRRRMQGRMKMLLKVFLVEDETVIREGLRDRIPWDQFGYRFVGEAADGEMALPLIRKTKPDVLITDIKMPFMDGLSLSKIVSKEFPRMKNYYYQWL